jgi:hypothetical protein
MGGCDSCRFRPAPRSSSTIMHGSGGQRYGHHKVVQGNPAGEEIELPWHASCFLHWVNISSKARSAMHVCSPKRVWSPRYRFFRKDPKRHASANFIHEISACELRKRQIETLPFERIMLDLLSHARLLKRFQIINGRKPERIIRALEGEHVGTIVHAD